ncbi:MKLN1 [Acanthosepion pharaonis]|uniref:MKLN1 n=1 Tax=Acanthosepion pharaonis TaxID=158019 RepID=A0A812C209_ACAPH|nr:MKLN1 [Sepia pharaonis]
MAGESHVLKYTVYKWSSYSSNYVPENIYHDRPQEQSSRWSSDSNNSPQVFGGPTDDHMIELLESGLKNDHVPETFYPLNEIDDNHFPVRYLKIVPLQAWGPSFNFSIWYIEIRGIDDTAAVKPCLNWYNMVGFSIYSLFFNDTPLLFFHSLLAFFKLTSFSRNNTTFDHRPGMRGGHQMCIDPLTETMYLYGGWDGNQDLADLWAYHVPSQSWSLSYLLGNDGEISLFFSFFFPLSSLPLPLSPLLPLCIPSSPSVSPSPPLYPPPPSLSLFSLYPFSLSIPFLSLSLFSLSLSLFSLSLSLFSLSLSLFSLSLSLFSLSLSIPFLPLPLYPFSPSPLPLYPFSPSIPSPPSLSGLESPAGPSARSCHKICLDYERKQIFSLGRYLDSSLRSVENLKSDFYMYDITSGKWTLITEDTAAMGGPKLVFDHQMAIDIDEQTIYVFGGRVLTSSSEGERSHEPTFSGLYSYHVPTNTWRKLRDDCNEVRSRIGHSMLFHPKKRLLYIFAGQRSKEYLNDFFTYDVEAHRVEVHYLFGGNPGKDNLPKMRLDDFWALKLSRPSQEHLLRRCIYLIRKYKFQEIAHDDPVKAVTYLQTELADMVDHADPQETKEFQLLASTLFKDKSDDEEMIETDSEVSEHFHSRTQLFDLLVNYFPENMTQPKGNLVDLITLK